MRDWADVGRIVTQTSSTSLSTLVRSIYQKLILPYENYIAQNEKRKLQRMAAVAGGGIVGSSTGGGVGQHYYRHQEASSPLSPRTPITNNLLNNNNNASPSPHPSASSPSPQSPPPPQHLNQQQPQLNHHNTNITRNSLSNRHLDGKEVFKM